MHTQIEKSAIECVETTNTVSIQFSRFTTDQGLLTKRMHLDEGNEVVKSAAVDMSEGRVDVLSVHSIDAFAQELLGLQSNQALAYGVPRRGSGPIMSKAAWERAGCPAKVQQRSLAEFTWADGPGVLMLDHDPRSGTDPLSREQLLDALYGAAPAIQSASHLWWISSSSQIFDRSADIERRGVCGQRVYVLIQSALDVERAGKALVDRLWLAGFGFIMLSVSGQMLERTLIDAAVFQTQRLDFASGAYCVAPLEQRRGAPLILSNGPPLDTRAVLPDLTDAESKELSAMKRMLKVASKPEADRIKAEWSETNATSVAKKSKIPIDQARIIAWDAIDRQRLRGDFMLCTEDGMEVTVSEVLRNRKAWHAKRFRHPLEPDYEDRRIAYANLDAGGHPYLFCHAHGGTKFTLHSLVTTVQVQGGAAPEAVNKVIDAMRDCREFFLRGSSLVTISPVGDLVLLSHHSLKNLVEGIVAFEKFNMQQKNEETGTRGKYVPCDMPDDLAQRVKAAMSPGTLPKIIGVKKHALITGEGRIFDEPGFDQATGLMLFEDPERPFSRIRRSPTLDEVECALHALWAPFARFPFDRDVDRGVMLSAILTAVVRSALPLAPGFLFAAPSAGAGKTLLAECLSEIAGGGSAQSLPSNEDEIRKGLVATLRTGHPVLFFDNLTGSPESAALCSLFTSDHYQGRILGVSEMTEPLPTRCLVLFSGNNLIAGGDLFRRVLRCYVDPKTSEPHSRKFDIDPLEYVREKKAEIIGAALTVLSGWVSTDAFKKARGRIGSFGAWDRLIGQCVTWLDLEGIRPDTDSGTAHTLDTGTDAPARFGDPQAAISEAQAADPNATDFIDLVTAWAKGDKDQGLGPALNHEVSMGKVFEQLERIRAGLASTDEIAGCVANALHRIGVMSKTSKGLGKLLAAYEKKMGGGYVLRSRSVSGAKLWHVAEAPVA